MKTAILSVCLLTVLAGCNSAPKKFRYPVVVTEDNTPIYSSTDTTTAHKITVAMKGDTLDLWSGALVGLCNVAPKPGRDRFPGSNKSGYISVDKLEIPPATLEASKSAGFPNLSASPAPAETDWRGKQ